MCSAHGFGLNYDPRGVCSASKCIPPPDHTLYDDTLERGPQGTDWLWGEGPAAIVWDQGLPPDYWDKLRRSRRTIITVTQQEAPEDPWFSVGAGAAGWTKYPVACKWHQCMKSSQSSRPMYTYTPRPIQPEVLDAVEEMLQELMAGGRPANVRRPAVALLPRTYLIPKRIPGFHLHPLPRLATVAGVVVATDGGTPGAKERAKARGVETIPDEGPGMTAAGVSRNPHGGRTAASIRAPATA